MRERPMRKVRIELDQVIFQRVDTHDAAQAVGDGGR
jgi:hypothetical protein